MGEINVVTESEGFSLIGQSIIFIRAETLKLCRFRLIKGRERSEKSPKHSRSIFISMTWFHFNVHATKLTIPRPITMTQFKCNCVGVVASVRVCACVYACMRVSKVVVAVVVSHPQRSYNHWPSCLHNWLTLTWTRNGEVWVFLWVEGNLTNLLIQNLLAIYIWTTYFVGLSTDSLIG